LTRGASYAEASQTLHKILTEQCLLGGLGDVRGGKPCICFSEAPIAKLSAILAQKDRGVFRYKPYGIMLEKDWLFGQGGRPVIYQPDADWSVLPPSIQWRHKAFDPPTVDFTWEREWRVQTNALPLDPSLVTVVVPNRKWGDELKEQHRKMVQRRASLTGAVPSSVGRFPWHFIALSDLGVRVPDEDL
jgi:hypothetical protein